MELERARSKAGIHRSRTHALELQDEHWSEVDDDNGGEVARVPWQNELRGSGMAVR